MHGNKSAYFYQFVYKYSVFVNWHLLKRKMAETGNWKRLLSLPVDSAYTMTYDMNVTTCIQVRRKLNGQRIQEERT